MTTRRRKQLVLLPTSELHKLETERDFQQRVTELARLNGWMVYSVPDSRRATLAGYPDLTMLHQRAARLLFAELKREKGRLSEAQVAVLDALRAVAAAADGAIDVRVWRPSDWDEIVVTLRALPRKKVSQKKSKKV